MAQAKKAQDDTTTNLGFEAKLWAAADALRNNMDAAEYKHGADNAKLGGPSRRAAPAHRGSARDCGVARCRRRPDAARSPRRGC